MRLGFIGTGAITEALIHGFLRDAPEDLTIVVSARGADTSGRLAACYPGVLTVSSDNQEVVDGCDVVFLAIRPQVVRDVVSGLRMREGQVVVSLVAMLAIGELRERLAPARHIVRAIPLPSAREGRSPTVTMPPDAAVRALFERVGTVTEVDDPEAFDALAAASAIMATHFAMAAAVTSWLEHQGVVAGAARDYVGQVLAGLARTAETSDGRTFSLLVTEHETPGGLNEQLRLHLAGAGTFAAMEAGLGLLHQRIRNGG